MLPVGDALAFVDVEEPVFFERTGEVLFGGGLDRGGKFGVGDFFFDEEGDVAAGGGVAADGFEFEGLGLGVFEGGEVDFGEDGLGGEGGGFGGEGMDLSEKAAVLAGEDDFSLPCRVEAGVGGVPFEGEGELSGPGEFFEESFEGVEAGLVGGGFLPVGAGAVTGGEDGEMGDFDALVWFHHLMDAAGFEDVEVGGAVSDGGFGEGGKEAVSEVGHFGGVGVTDEDSVGGGVEGVGVSEGVGDGLVVAGAEEGLLDGFDHMIETMGSSDRG